MKRTLEFIDNREPATQAFATGSAASLPDLIRAIQKQLGPTSSRRIGVQHAAVLHTLIGMGNAWPDINLLYKAMLATRYSMVMSKLYRVLKVLEEARVIERHWVQQSGRPRSVYCVVGRAREGEDNHGPVVCRFCGVSLHDLRA